MILYAIVGAIRYSHALWPVIPLIRSYKDLINLTYTHPSPLTPCTLTSGVGRGGGVRVCVSDECEGVTVRV